MIVNKTPRIRRRMRSSTTGVVGVSYSVKRVRRVRGVVVTPFFQAWVRNAEGREHCRQFNCLTLGRAEAFRRAVRARAEYEMAIAGTRKPETGDLK
jgi:hypothetical protein